MNTQNRLNNEEDQPQKVTYPEAQKKLETVQVERKTINEENRESEIQSRELSLELLQLQEKQQVLDLRRRWAWFFLGITIAILIFEVVITLLVGADILEFEDEWFLRIIIAGGFSQILVMPYLVTRFLFDSGSSEEEEKKIMNEE